jgi:gliding motility-associated-like protein
MLHMLAGGSGGCPAAEDTLVLNIGLPPSADAGPDLATCLDGPVAINGASMLNYKSILWSHNGSGNLTGANLPNPVYTPAPGETGLVTLTLVISGTGTCDADTSADQMEIQFLQPVSVDAGPEQSIPRGTSTTLSGSVEGGSGSYSFHWEPNDFLENSNLKDPVTLPLTQSMTFFLVVNDSETSCSGKDSIRIHIKEVNTEECLVFHNVITPNGDGANDTWIIDCIENFPLNQVSVFNRWGDVIREFENYNNTSMAWNGTNSRDESVPDGTYYYVLAIRNGGSYQGWILVRGTSE